MTASDPALNTAPVAAVKIDHQAIAADRTIRDPKRSASQPPGIWNSAYVQLKAETLQPMVILSSPNSAMIFGVAEPMQARSRNMTRPTRKLKRRT
jgi:hypothetical protein